MMQFLDRLFDVRPSVIVLKEKKAVWTVEDAHAWKEFCAGQTGEKILAIMEDLAINERNKVNPACDSNGISYRAGAADGMAMAVQHIKSLFPAGVEEDEDDGGGDEY